MRKVSEVLKSKLEGLVNERYTPEYNNDRLFAIWLIGKYPDTSTAIDENAAWQEFSIQELS